MPLMKFNCLGGNWNGAWVDVDFFRFNLLRACGWLTLGVWIFGTFNTLEDGSG